MVTPWKRSNPREDGLTPGIAQRVEYAYGDRVAGTHEPHVRMDITTAVQIASLSEYPMGIVELLTESAPVALDPLGGPLVTCVDRGISSMVMRADRWRCELARRARVARQAVSIDKPAIERRAANLREIEREDRLMRIATRVVAIALVVCVAALARLVVMLVFGV